MSQKQDEVVRLEGLLKQIRGENNQLLTKYAQVKEKISKASEELLQINEECKHNISTVNGLPSACIHSTVEDLLHTVSVESKRIPT